MNKNLMINDTPGIHDEWTLKCETAVREVLIQNNIDIKSIDIEVGPAVSRYRIYPCRNIGRARISGLSDEISFAIGKSGIRLVTYADYIGVEIPNEHRSKVRLTDLLSSEEFRSFRGELPVAAGITIGGRLKVMDLVDAPHLLIAGATGQGESSFVRGIIASLMAVKLPEEVKIVYMSHTRPDISAEKWAALLGSICTEMEKRYEVLANARVSNIRKLNNGNTRKLPYIVVIIDDYAQFAFSENRDMSRNIKASVIRLARTGRAAGIHLVLATRRPASYVITGSIKTNIPTRIAFKVSTKEDSRLILDESGAEKLIGNGDAILSSGADSERLQCGYITMDEMAALENQLKDVSETE